MRVKVILDKEKIVKMLDSGATLLEVAGRFGVGHASISNFLRKNNIQNPNGKKFNADMEKLVAMRESGITLAEIADSFGVVPQTISNALKAKK